MSTLHHASIAAAKRRRARLTDLLEGVPALICAGAPTSRNFPANVYPFRASSHFLYLVGHALPGAFALIEGERTRLFMQPPAEDDALWHGAVPSFARLSEELGCELVDLAQL
ncbi:MAG: aminopeptidase P family protein, partial [Deltaproteobacteria bacterium]|nr:aminopeptidase P family protein [Deltaproteobacteria bacterium]